MYTGSCLCGAIKYELRGELSAPRYCHCENCRKFSGTSPATWAMATWADLVVEDTQASVGEYNSGRGLRCFCSQCGSVVWFKSIDFPQIVGIPLGCLDSGDIPAPQMHLWFDSKPGWCTVNDDKPRFAQGPE